MKLLFILSLSIIGVTIVLRDTLPWLGGDPVPMWVIISGIAAIVALATGFLWVLQ